MPALIYLHGFLSSPASHKAQQVQAWLEQSRPDLDYHCPLLSPYPQQTQQLLEQLVESLLPEPVYLMGSSLGGYWASYLAEKYDLRALLINPAVQPSLFLPKYIGVELQNYHTDERYLMTEAHAQQLRDVDTPQIKRRDNYWLLVQTGDETLDYRLAVKKYHGCQQHVETGGDHSFQGFENLLPAAIEFLEKTPQSVNKTTK